MRHIVGFLAGLILAPVIVLTTGWAQPRLTSLNESGGTFVSASGAITIAALCGLGLLLALVLVGPRLTPLLSGIAGLTLVGLTALDHLRPDVLQRVPDAPGTAGAFTLIPLGTYLPLSLVLVVPLFVPSRWTRRRAGEAVTEEEYFDGLYDEDYEGGAPGMDSEPRGGQHRA